MNASSTETGIVMMGTIADGMCQKKRRITALTIAISISSSCLRLSIDASISVERS
jgi:hypothetical protein